MSIYKENITSGNSHKGLATLISLLLMGGIAFLSTTQSPPAYPVIFLFAIIVFVIAFVKIEVALTILIFSMLLSPEISAGGVPGREVVIRLDDIFLLVIFFAWIARMSLCKELGMLRSNPLIRPILMYIFIAILATLLGALQGLVNLNSSMFYILKYSEYFLLFFMVANNINDMDQVKDFVFFLLITCFIVSAYAWYLHFQGVERVAAPFDFSDSAGESNTLAAYLLFMMAVVAGLLIYSVSLHQRIVLLGLLCFMTPPFLFTLSRGAWLGFIPMYLTLTVLTKKGRHILFGVLLIIVALSPVLLPGSVTDRVTGTFESGREYTVFGKEITLAESGAARIELWVSIIEKWYKRPFLGYGVTGVGFVDSQYARVLGETGLIGFLLFAWVLATVFKKGRQTLHLVQDEWSKGLTLGFLAGFVGLLIHAFSASTFILVRVMEPFWFLAAIVIMLPEISSIEHKSNNLHR